jgi:hypothetical protein
MRFDALSICFCCLALSFTCVPQPYMGFPIFKLLFFIFLANVKEYAEKREARQDSISASLFT